MALLGFKKHKQGLAGLTGKKTSLLILGLVGVTLASIFMIHMKSSFIWAKLPILWYMQFPWRFLAISIFLLCLLSGLLVYLAGKYKYVLGIILVLISFALTINYFVPKAWLNITDTDKFSGISWEKQLTISIFDYLPIYAKLPPYSKAPDLPEVLKGNVKFLEYKKGSDFQIGAVEALNDARIRLPLFDFPGLEVKVDGNIVPHINNDCTGERYCLGLITFDLPVGQHLVEARLTNTFVRKSGNIITLVSFGVIIYLAIKSKRNEKVFPK